MRRLRWLLLEFVIATLLLVTAYATLWPFAKAAAPVQTEPPTTDANRLPAPPASGVGQPLLSPENTRPAADAASTVTPTNDSASTDIVAASDITVTGTPTYYVVLSGDTLFVIANDFGTTLEAVMEANGLSNADLIHTGQVLLIPGPDGELPDPALMPMLIADDSLTQTVIVPRGTITERMTSLAQQATLTSPYYNMTWLTYYGRPNIDVMGILGEYSIEELVPLLRKEAEAYDRANGDSLKIMPAFHLVYGMATKAAGEDDSHLAYMSDEDVNAYIKAAEAEGWGVLLDVQIGALSPSEAISPALAFLDHPNVHLAIDPEFAMSHKGQSWPGDPIGFITAEQVNEVQEVINSYIISEHLPGPRILLVHQFQSSMIVDKENLDASGYPQVALTLSVDGWGGPWGKISKYNSLVDTASPYVAFKLFYRWDEPLLLPDEVFGNRAYRGSDFFMDVTPNFIIFQ